MSIVGLVQRQAAGLASMVRQDNGSIVSGGSVTGAGLGEAALDFGVVFFEQDCEDSARPLGGHHQHHQTLTIKRIGLEHRAGHSGCSWILRSR